jgi:hypothetical protein
MHKIIIIVRVGSPFPLEKEKAIARELVEPNLDLAGWCTLNFGIVSAFYTNWTIDQIVARFKECEESTDDSLPIIVFEYGDPKVGNTFNFSGFTDMVQAIQEGVDALPKVNKLELDQLLDLIKERGGIAALTTEELARLHHLAKNNS